MHLDPRPHALLSASGSAKWLACTPSAREESKYPNKASAFSREGEYAHAVFQQKMEAYLGLHVTQTPEGLDEFDTPELRDYVDQAVDRAIALVNEARSQDASTTVMVEHRVDFSPWVPNGYGTADLIILSDRRIYVVDLKYGKGIFVPAKNNSQLRLYGVGALNDFGAVYNLDEVSLHILQPRLENYASDSLTSTELLVWAEQTVKPKALLAWSGEGQYVPGEHCTESFCRARLHCEARKQQALALMQSEFLPAPPELLNTDQKQLVLQHGPAVIKWIQEVISHLEQLALDGTPIPGHKLVLGRGMRKFTDLAAISARLRQAGIPEDQFIEKSLLSLTALEKALGKKKFAELLDEFIVKHPGKPTLVPESDNRPAYVPVAQSLAAEFSETSNPMEI
jgi:hypothetical protein